MKNVESIDMKKIKSIEFNDGSAIFSFENKEEYMKMKKFLLGLERICNLDQDEHGPCKFVLKFSNNTNKVLVEDKVGVKKNKGVNDLLEALSENTVQLPSKNNTLTLEPNKGTLETDSLLYKKNK